MNTNTREYDEEKYITEEQVDEILEGVNDFSEEDFKLFLGSEDVSSYENLAKKYGLYTAEEELAAFRRLKAGDKNAKYDIFCHNVRLPMYIASRKFFSAINQSISYKDLVQEGIMGLFRAIDRFDPDKGYRFATYACYWVYQSINRFVENNRATIRVPVHAQSNYRKLKKILAESWNPDEINEQFSDVLSEYGPNSQEFLAFRCMTIQSIHKKVNDCSDSRGDDSELIDFIPDNTSVSEIAEKDFLSEELDKQIKEKLSEREYFVLKHRFGLAGEYPKTLEKVGAMLGVTRERIRQIEEKALKKLRHPSSSSKLKDFLLN